MFELAKGAGLFWAQILLAYNYLCLFDWIKEIFFCQVQSMWDVVIGMFGFRGPKAHKWVHSRIWYYGPLGEKLAFGRECSQASIYITQHTENWVKTWEKNQEISIWTSIMAKTNLNKVLLYM